jgi:diguanylate cyclase (GGDEF)-like protein
MASSRRIHFSAGKSISKIEKNEGTKKRLKWDQYKIPGRQCQSITELDAAADVAVVWAGAAAIDSRTAKAGGPMAQDFNLPLQLLEDYEKLSAKFFQVETRILSILNFKDLFNVLLTEIESVFEVPHVWLTLIEDSEAGRLLPFLESEQDLALRLTRIDRQRFAKVVGTDQTPVLSNRNLGCFAELFPEHGKGRLASLAVVPLFLDGGVIGSLNLGDENPRRYTPDMDPVFLKHLGVKLSLCLSNVTAHEKLSFLAYHDALTGLLNRRVMKKVLQRECSRCQRYGHPLSVVFIDLDDFKKVNDTYGHETGDALLRHWAQLLNSCTRSSDVAARFAGDEFVVILPESDSSAAGRLMERVISAARSQPLKTASTQIPVSLSFGIAAMGEEKPDSPESLLKRADGRLYEAKKGKPHRSGRTDGRVFSFAPAAEKKKKP